MKKYVFESLKFFCATILCTILSAFATPSWGALPDGYTELQYIESTGTQYIDTNFAPNNNTSVETRAQLYSESNVRFFAVYNESSSTPYYGVGFSGSKKWVNQTNTSNTVTNTSTDENLHIVYKNKTALYVDGTQIDNSGSGNFTSNYSIYLLAANVGGTASFISSGKLYHTKIWDNDTLVRNFVPAKNASGAVGMYDTVNNRFYTNAGTGEFIAGPTVSTIGQCDFDIANIYKVGTPTITNAGIYTTNSSESYIRTRNDVAFATANTWSFKWRFTYHPANSDQGIMSGDGGTNVQAIINSAGRPRFSFGNDTSWNAGVWNDMALTFAYQDGVTYDNEIYFDGTRYGFKVNGTEIGGIDSTTKAANTYFAIGVERGRTSAQYSRAEWDLTHTSLTLDGVEQLPWCGGSTIKIATTKYNESAFGPLNTALQNAISVVDTVVSNTITQAGRIATLQAQKQTRPNDIADDNEKCPAGKKCLLVEDASGVPHWYEIVEPLLPAGYIQLQWIESTGTQWFDTETYGKTKTSVHIKYEPTGASSTQGFGIIGFQATFGGADTFARYTWTNQGNDQFRFGGKSNESGIQMLPNIVREEIFGNNKWTIDGQTINISTINSNFSTSDTMTLFVIKSLDGEIGDRSLAKMKLYYCTIYDDGTMVRDFVPAKNPDGKIGMYDLVGGRFYENQGTGEFVAGDPVAE